MSKKDKNEARTRRKKSIRKRISGTEERPRLSVYRSNKHIYAQVIDDTDSRSILLVSDLTKALAAELEAAKTAPTAAATTEEDATPDGGPDGAKMRRARVVGAAVAKACLDKGIKKVVFDRNGYLYHGRVRALAEAARAAGLDF